MVQPLNGDWLAADSVCRRAVFVVATQVTEVKSVKKRKSNQDFDIKRSRMSRDDGQTTEPTGGELNRTVSSLLAQLK